MNNQASLLFVDDEVRIINLLRTMFRSQYQVYTATSGQEALRIAAEHPIDVIVSDQRMPSMTGIELLAEMRKQHPATMRILLTGYSDLAAIVGSINDGGVFRFINKPWNHDDMKQIIAEAAAAAHATAGIMAQPAAAESATAAATINVAARPGVLLIDDDPADELAVVAALKDQFAVHSANSFDAALKALEKFDIGVIVTEAKVGGRDIGSLLGILKRHHPAVTAIMMTNMEDSHSIIHLINNAQIFRLSGKPIRGSALRLATTAAMREYHRISANPALAKRHSVNEASHSAENSSLVASVVASLSNLRNRFRRFAH